MIIFGRRTDHKAESGEARETKVNKETRKDSMEPLCNDVPLKAKTAPTLSMETDSGMKKKTKQKSPCDVLYREFDCEYKYELMAPAAARVEEISQKPQRQASGRMDCRVLFVWANTL